MCFGPKEVEGRKKNFLFLFYTKGENERLGGWILLVGIRDVTTRRIRIVMSSGRKIYNLGYTLPWEVEK